MELVVNGKHMQVSEGLTASELLQQLGIQPERVVVEVNVTVLKRDQLASTVLNAGDQVEIVHFVGGGASQAACHRLQAARQAPGCKLQAYNLLAACSLKRAACTWSLQPEA